jgi:hypothetical protein
MQKRRRFQQTVSLADRLSTFAKEVRERASRLPPGPAREELMKKVCHAEAALRLDGWAGSEKASLGQAGDDDPLTAARHP